ncbi:hypothetical protein N7539_000830 [Penicillium diatomitis]|uniref:Zn(2)-C6 fungal-type domain-containing protein n=1 Tax=Penicillium diatomitis TaxID=2819901 RepID=A0A9X0C338_9EURO|nr:uncharacterized protein N7539_000830 [Penicillium diatomitis]KAJ5495714.1 hypothetical protein N7539_000830 [Penicillium diatomitis]
MTKVQFHEAQGSLNGRKRKPSNSDFEIEQQPNALPKDALARKKITRACDSCKSKKTKCTGTLPCARCMRHSLPCDYTACYSRGLPPEPIPATPNSVPPKPTGTGNVRSGSRVFRVSGSKEISKQRCAKINVGNLQDHGNVSRKESPQDSPEPGSTDLEGNYIGPASGISFIKRVWARLRRDEISQNGIQVKDNLQSTASPFTSGDKPYPGHSEATFSLPPFAVAMELITVYFDFSMVTYRFLHYRRVKEWAQQLYAEQFSAFNLPVGVMATRAAIVLMIFAVGSLHADTLPSTESTQSERWFAAAMHLMNFESGPPSLETIQVRLIQCFYLLSSSRANECWYCFGTALQVVTAMGLHRRRATKRAGKPVSTFELEMQKRVFWSVYTLDKYLSIMFGRPRLLHDEDIDQELPDGLRDEDFQEDKSTHPGEQIDNMMTASILHFRLGRILAELSRQLYSINQQSQGSMLAKVPRLTRELEEWRESVPPILKNIPSSSLPPTLRRQRQVLRLGYNHAMIHATRSFLLVDACDSKYPPTSRLTIVNHVNKCVRAAKDVMTLIEDLAQQKVIIQSFWFTHYVTFCAVLVAYIYIIQQLCKAENAQATTAAQDELNTEDIQSLFLLTESSQRYLAEATRTNCPSRRYSTILTELREEVHRQLDSKGQLKANPLPALNGTGTIQDFEPTRQKSSITDECSMAQVAISQDIGENLPPTSDIGFISDLDPDFSFLEELEGSTWWTQLDSWVSSPTRSRFNLSFQCTLAVPADKVYN